MAKRKLYNSSAAFALGDAVFTASSSGCLRAIVIAAHDIRNDIAEEYRLVGALHEHLHFRRLGDQLKARELPVKRDVTDNVLQSGRIDFVLLDHSIDETKGTYSDSVRRSAIKNGQPKLNHLAQLVSYLINEQQPRGRLIYGYYEETEEGYLVRKEQRDIEISLRDDGAILIDGAVSEWTVADQLKHTTLAAAALYDIDQVPDRPINADDGFASPCRFCDFRSACDKYDNGSTTFFDDAREALANKPSQAVKIKRSKK